MAGFEEEALERARRMSHNRRSAARREDAAFQEPKPEAPREPESRSRDSEPKPSAPPEPKPKPQTPQRAVNPADILLKDKENSLILMLLLLLMDSGDPSLIFTLMYLLM